jgi:hypothetical protein
MIAFGTAMVDAEAYRRYARPGIDRAVEPDSEVIALAALASTPRSLNLLLERAARLDDLEALVIVDQDAEIADPAFCSAVRAALADPSVALAGPTGARGVQTVAWWDAAVSSARVVHRYEEHGGGELEAFAWARDGAALGEVESLAGFLLVLSPWAVRELRFDETLLLSVGFDLDLCRRARAAGRKVVTADLPVVLHRSLDVVDDHDVWIEAHIAAAERFEPAGTDWKARARRAEAERDAARARSYSEAVLLEARLAPLERELDELTGSLSWRLTEPLRRLNARRRR